MKRFTAFISNIINACSVKKKFLFIILFVISLLSITSLISLSLIVTSYNNMLHKSVATTLSYSASNISKELSTIEALSSTVVVDKTIQTHLSGVKDSDDIVTLKNAGKTLYNTLSSYYQQFQYNHLSYMALYSDKLSTTTYIKPSLKLPDELLQELLASAVDHQGLPIIITNYCDTYGLFILREIRRVDQLSLDKLGVLIICINISDLIEDSSSHPAEYGDLYYILSTQDEIILSNTDVAPEDIKKLNAEKRSSYDIIETEDTQYFSVNYSLPKYEWNYNCLLPYHSVYQALITARNVFLTILLLSILISITLSIQLLVSLTRHLDHLIQKIKYFGDTKGQLAEKTYDYANRNDEFGILHNKFDEMAGEISTLINVNYRMEILMKEAQLKALEMQINPHFLYNTLESVNWRAKFIGEKQISQMVESLGCLLRFTMDKDNGIVSLKEELEYIQYYITIQKTRFEGQLEFYLEIQSEIQEKLLSQKIPKLVIQPLVENSIHYGMEAFSNVCIISLSIYQLEETVKIDVKNSGSHFDDQLIEKLNSGEHIPNGLGIGLLNIDSRIKLTFGDRFGVSCFNKEGFAVASITIPWKNNKEVTHVKTCDCR